MTRPDCSGRGYRLLPAIDCCGEIDLVKDPCGTCAGSGKVVECEACRGAGEVERQIGGDGYGDRCCALADVMCVCGECDGKGWVYVSPDMEGLLEETCPECGGSGKTPQEVV